MVKSPTDSVSQCNWTLAVGLVLRGRVEFSAGTRLNPVICTPAKVGGIPITMGAFPTTVPPKLTNSPTRKVAGLLIVPVVRRLKLRANVTVRLGLVSVSWPPTVIHPGMVILWSIKNCPPGPLDILELPVTEELPLKLTAVLPKLTSDNKNN